MLFRSSTLIVVSDTSNNGSQEAVDPNQNGNANEEDENIPTPFSITILPVHFLDVTAKYISANDAQVSWYVATPVVNGRDFTVQYSNDGKNWQDLSVLPITDNHKGSYTLFHYNLPSGNLLYRIRQTDNDGNFVISKIVMLRKNAEENHFVIYPNPADNQVTIISDQLLTAKSTLRIYDATGRNLLQLPFSSQSISIPTEQLPGGTYLMSIENNGNKTIRKFVVSHR